MSKSEGCFLQTLNAGCMVVFIVIAVIVITVIVVSNQTSTPPTPATPSVPVVSKPQPSTTPGQPTPANPVLQPVQQPTIEPEPDWGKRFDALKQKELSTLSPPKVGDYLTLERRIGGNLSGKLTALGTNTVAVDGKTFQASQLTPETCEAIFPDLRATSLAMRQVQMERNDYRTRKAELDKKMVAKHEPMKQMVFPVINKDIFGLNLGESVDSFKKKCAKVNVHVENMTVNPSDDKRWLSFQDYAVVGPLTKEGRDSAVKRMAVSFFSDQLVSVSVTFQIVSSETEKYKTLKSTLEKNCEKTYDKDIVESHFRTTVDGEEIEIVLFNPSGMKTPEGPIQLKPQLYLRYTYKSLEKRSEAVMDTIDGGGH